MCQCGGVVTATTKEKASKEQVITIGIDLAKQSFQVHGACGDGSVSFRKNLSRGKLLGFLASHPSSVVAMEACASANYWGREISELGHDVKLIAPIYVKPFVKRQKNDTTDAEAISEAAQRPTMRFVAVKTAEQQASGMLFRTRDLLVRQRTQTINALRGHLAEFGIVAPQGPAHVNRLAQALADPELPLPDRVRTLGTLLFDRIVAVAAAGQFPTAAPSPSERFSIGKSEKHSVGIDRPSRGSGRLPRWRCRLLHRRSRASGKAGTLPPGWALCPASTRPAASRGWAGSRRGASAISHGC